MIILRHTTIGRTPVDDGQPDAETSTRQNKALIRKRYPRQKDYKVKT